MILDITSMASRAKEFVGKGNDYDILLGELLKIDYYDEDSFSLPSLKELVQTTGINNDKVRKYIKKIYEDLIAYEKPFQFNEILITFSLNA